MNYFLAFSLAAPCCLAVSNLVDNHVLHVRLRDPISYDILTSLAGLPVAAAIYFGTRVSFAFGALVVGTTIGFLFTFLFLLYTFAMMKEQGTNVVSVIYTNPLFIAVLASLFLGESLSAVNYAGILLLVASAFLVLYRRVGSSNIGLVLLLVYAFGLAAARVATKNALEGVDVWSYFFWLIIGGALGAMVLAAIRWEGLRGVLKRLDRPTTTLIAVSTGFSSLGPLLLFTALSLGSVTLASSLAAIQPFVVLVYSTVLLRFRPGAIPPEKISGRWADVRKAGAALLIVVGVLALSGA